MNGTGVRTSHLDVQHRPAHRVMPYSVILACDMMRSATAGIFATDRQQYGVLMSSQELLPLSALRASPISLFRSNASDNMKSALKRPLSHRQRVTV